MSAPAPAPDSTRISSPACCSLPSASGTRATRRSPAAVSLATPTFIGHHLLAGEGRGVAFVGSAKGYRPTRARVRSRRLRFGRARRRESGDARTNPHARAPQPRAARPAAVPRPRLAGDPRGARGDRRDPEPVRAGRLHRVVDAPPRVPAGGVDGGARGARGRPGDADALDDPSRVARRL